MCRTVSSISTDVIFSNWVGRWLCFTFPSSKHSLRTPIFNCGDRLSWWGDLGKSEKERRKEPRCCNKRLFSSIIWVQLGNRCFASFVRFFLCPYYYLTTFPYPAGIFYAQMKDRCWVTILWYYRIFCTSLALTTLWSPQSKCFSQNWKVPEFTLVSVFLLEFRLYRVKLKGITFLSGRLLHADWGLRQFYPEGQRSRVIVHRNPRWRRWK